MDIFPILPHTLQRIHQKEHPFTEPECISHDELLFLCDKLSEAYSETPLWKYAKGYFEVSSRGHYKAFQYLKSIGIGSKFGQLALSPEWETMPLLEFMDAWQFPGLLSTETRNLAKRAQEESWRGYRKVKGDLTPPGAPEETPSFLIQPVLGEVTRACKRSGVSNVVWLGPDVDEMWWGLQHPNLTVVGLNASNSPQLEGMIGKRVTRLDKPKKPRDTIDPSSLTSGCYLMEWDVLKDGIPIRSGTAIYGMSYFVHHIPSDRQVEMMRNIARVATFANGRQQFYISEDSLSFVMFMLMRTLNPDYPVTSWDAIMSYLRGKRLITTLKQSDLRLQYYQKPPILDSLGGGVIIPATNTIITSRKNEAY
jgi:hypothetical protein